MLEFSTFARDFVPKITNFSYINMYFGYNEYERCCMSKKRKKRLKNKKSFAPKLKPATIFSVVQVTFFVMAGLVVVSFSRQGSILRIINDWLIGLFSWTSVFLPFILAAFGFVMTKIKIPLSQPNVLVGSLLFFISLTGLARAGRVGIAFWDGIATLITAAGAFIVLFGLTVVGLIILFNTSIDAVVELFVSIFRNYGVRGKPGITGKRELKVLGEDRFASGPAKINKPVDFSEKTSGKDLPLQQQLVSNLPGEVKVWKYPDLELLSDGGTGKADRGDIKGNAAIIEQTLESFGITARVVEVNLGPAVTQYAIEVALGTKLSKITALERDLALSLAAPTGTIRIEAPIPGGR